MNPPVSTSEVTIDRTTSSTEAPLPMRDFRRLDRRRMVRDLVLSSLGLLFWCGIFIVFFRVLLYFQRIEGIGDILAAKLLSMVLLTLFSILIFSNIVTALSTYFLSDDLECIISRPVSMGNYTERDSWIRL